MELIHFLTMYWFRPGPEWPMPICPNLQSGWQDKYAFEFQTDQFLALRDQLEQRKLILVEKQNPHERIGRKTNNKQQKLDFPKCCFFVVFVFWFVFFCSLWYWFFFVFCCKQPYILCVVTVVSSGLRAGHPTTHWSNVKITAGRPNAARAFVACPRATPDTP